MWFDSGVFDELYAFAESYSLHCMMSSASAEVIYMKSWMNVSFIHVKDKTTKCQCAVWWENANVQHVCS